MEHTHGHFRQGSLFDCATGAMSLVETLIVIAFLAIVAAISVPSISGLVSSSNYQTATRNLNYLNGAVIAFNQSNWELVLATSGGSDDEQKIFDSLRYRNATNPAPGSPNRFVAGTRTLL